MKELCTALGVCDQTIYNRIKRDGLIKRYRCGARILYDLDSALNAYSQPVLMEDEKKEDEDE